MTKFCQNCGKTLEDNVQFCDGCGQSQEEAQASGQQQQQQQQPPQQQQTPPQQQQPPAPGQETYTAEDIQKNKVMAGLAYILFFLPLVACPESRYGRFHANQGLLLLIVSIGGSIILGIIPIIGWLLLPIFYIVVMVFAILGLVNGLNGKAKPLPIFGKLQIIK